MLEWLLSPLYFFFQTLWKEGIIKGEKLLGSNELDACSTCCVQSWLHILLWGQVANKWTEQIQFCHLYATLNDLEASWMDHDRLFNIKCWFCLLDVERINNRRKEKIIHCHTRLLLKAMTFLFYTQLFCFSKHQRCIYSYFINRARISMLCCLSKWSIHWFDDTWGETSLICTSFTYPFFSISFIFCCSCLYFYCWMLR